MAKGDQAKASKYLDSQNEIGQQGINQLKTNFQDQNQNLQGRYNQSAEDDNGLFNNIMTGYNTFLRNQPGLLSGYSNFANGGRDISLDPQYKGNVDSALGGYQTFADTGGYSPQDLAQMRARGESQVRSVYSSAQNNLDRAKLIGGGGGLPNYAAATAKLTRDQSQSVNDAQTNLEASLADSIRQGKLAGLSGLSNVGGQMLDRQTNIGQVNNAGRLSGLAGLLQGGQQNLSALSGMNSLYGTTPGRTSMYGNQLSNSNQNMNTAQGLQQALIELYLNGITNNSKIPSAGNQAAGTAATIAKYAAIAAMFL